jgi:hypothetical protein
LQKQGYGIWDTLCLSWHACMIRPVSSKNEATVRNGQHTCHSGFIDGCTTLTPAKTTSSTGNDAMISIPDQARFSGAISHVVTHFLPLSPYRVTVKLISSVQYVPDSRKVCSISCRCPYCASDQPRVSRAHQSVTFTRVRSSLLGPQLRLYHKFAYTHYSSRVPQGVILWGN